MATNMKKNTSKKATTETTIEEAVETVVVKEAVEEVVEEVVETVKDTKIEPKKFKETDPIKCVSITAGELGMLGIKTGINYTWAGRGDETDVEYQDLVAAIRSGKKQITAPRFIIKDEDFLAQYPQVEKIYTSMLSYNDLKDILKLDVVNMKKVISQLPAGAKDSIKNIASTQITNGFLDSVQKIKALDEIFDTKFMLMTELFK